MTSKVRTYDEMVEYIKQIGFLPLSKNPIGYISLEDLTPPYSWHTGNEYDPWTWKDRVAFEKKAAYARIFNKKPLFVSLEWYPYFLAVYKKPETVSERYESGTVSNMALRIYELLESNGSLNTHDIKRLLGIRSKEDSYKYEKGIVELQESMDITVCGASKRVDKFGQPYGWLISEYTTIEQWMGEEALNSISLIPRSEALSKLVSKVKEIAPQATENKILKFLALKKVL